MESITIGTSDNLMTFCESKHKFIHESTYGGVTVETYSVSLDDLVQEFKNYLLAVGYQPESIKEYFND